MHGQGRPEEAPSVPQPTLRSVHRRLMHSTAKASNFRIKNQAPAPDVPKREKTHGVRRHLLIRLFRR